MKIWVSLLLTFSSISMSLRKIVFDSLKVVFFESNREITHLSYLCFFLLIIANHERPVKFVCGLWLGNLPWPHQFFLAPAATGGDR